jgi:4-amino-4-deoxy-L-arabinose transferase-like glycosyltransferase
MIRFLSGASSPWQTRIAIVLCTLLAIGLRYDYVVHATVFQPAYLANARGDAVDYYRYAQNLATRGTYSQSILSVPPIADSFRDPGYPFFLAAWMKVLPQWDAWYAAVLISQALLGGLTVALILLSLAEVLPIGLLIPAGLLMAVWPHSISITSHLLSETLFAFLCALAFYLLSRCLSNPGKASAAASGIAFSLAALCNAAMLPFAPLLAAYLFKRRYLNLSTALVFATAAIVTVSPWMVRNAMLSGPHPSSAERAWANLVQGSWPVYHDAYQAAMKKYPPAIDLMNDIGAEVAITQSHPAKGIALLAHRMMQHPFLYGFWYVTKPALFWGWNIRMGQGDIYVYPTLNSRFKTKMSWRIAESLCEALNPLIGLLAGMGCLFAMRARNSSQATADALAAMLLYVTLIYALLQSEPRYSIPFRGFEIGLSLFSATCIYGRLKLLKISRLG